jgi:hypothetical protein
LITIRELFGQRSPATQRAILAEKNGFIDIHNSIPVDLEALAKNFWAYRKQLSQFNQLVKEQVVIDGRSPFIGIESELENVHLIPEEDPFCFPGWQLVGDGSLRDGKEFVSWPLLPKEIVSVVSSLFYGLSIFTKNNPNCSWRTSIHVHMDVQPLTLEQFGNLILLYLPFEQSLFNFSGKHRQESIFCVPITTTEMFTTINEILSAFLTPAKFERSILEWSKYSALNIGRLADYGTVEFRHMEGTTDIERVLNWIKILLSLYRTAIGFSREEILQQLSILNTSCAYAEFTNLVFKKEASLFGGAKETQAGISKGVTFSKQVI